MVGKIKRYVFAGASSRGLYMYAKTLYEDFRDLAELAGVYDINPVRARIFSEECGGIPVFDNFGRMLAQTKPDAVIVTTVDGYHHEYIIKALEAGCDAISEKPMTIDAEKCRQILDAEKKTGKKVIVTFNCRFDPYIARVKELLKEGIIGKILGVDFEWNLDTKHGADYFRRWHRYLKNSGGLLVHKATHHFDMLNWWIDDAPQEVFASGSLRFYGKNGDKRGERCITCGYKQSCDFYFDLLSNEFYKRFYADAEKADGYYRDGCVFSEDIDIYDTVSVNVRYAGGSLLTYSLVAYAAYEGWKVAFNGTHGRLEAREYHSGRHMSDNSGAINVYKLNGELISCDIVRDGGGHGGGDEKLMRMIFGDDMPDPLGQHADSTAGALSLLVGAAANISIKEDRPVLINDLLSGIK